MQDLKRILSTAVDNRILQNIADHFFQKMNLNQHFVTCKAFKEASGDYPAF